MRFPFSAPCLLSLEQFLGLTSGGSFVVMTLKTLADVRELIARHLPARCREQHIWRHVADQLAAAARGGSIDNVVHARR